MSELLFPERSRCAQCRKKLVEGEVLSGKFCSLRCGKLTAPAAKVEVAPRSCRREDAVAGWVYKKRYDGPMLVPAKYRDDPATNVYECENCHRFHIGHRKPDTSHNPFGDNLDAIVSGAAEIGVMIGKYREALGVTRKTVANRLKVPIVRVKELEEGAKGVELKLLFDVMQVLRMRVVVQAQAPNTRR